MRQQIGRPRGILKAGQGQTNKINAMLPRTSQNISAEAVQETLDSQTSSQGADPEDSDMEDTPEPHHNE